MVKLQSMGLIRGICIFNIALSALTLGSVLWGPAASRPGAYSLMLGSLSGLLIAVSLLLFPLTARRRFLPMMTCTLALVLAAVLATWSMRFS